MRRAPWWTGLLAVIALVAAGAATPARAGADGGPAAPVRLSATNGSSSITLSWSQPETGSRPVSFRVHEGSTVVARNTTTWVTVSNLAVYSTHTYQVTAVDSAGRESPPSAPITRQVRVGGPFACGITVPSVVAVTEVTASAVALSWSNEVPYYDQPGTLVVFQGDAVVRETSLDSARIGGLAPATTYTFQVARRDCVGGLHRAAPLTVTTAGGAGARPAVPGAVTVGTRTASSVALAWSAGVGSGAAVRYAVYEGATRVATTSATSIVLTGLWRDTAHEYTVAAIDGAGNESAQTPPVRTSTQPCPDGLSTPGPVNPPTELTATVLSPSSIALTWAQEFPATSFTVYRVASATLPLGPVVTTRTNSAMITGLPSASTASYAVRAQTASCGQSALSASVSAGTPAGPSARPTAPTDPKLVSSTPNYDFTGTVRLAWNQPVGTDPAVLFRLYEGTSILATSTSPEITLRLPGGPTHAVTVVAVDAAGLESAQSAPLVFTVAFIPPP